MPWHRHRPLHCKSDRGQLDGRKMAGRRLAITIEHKGNEWRVLMARLMAAAWCETLYFYININRLDRFVQGKSWRRVDCRRCRRIVANDIPGVRASAAVALAFLLFPVMPNVALSGELSGQASVIDGDTLEIRGQRIRLWGIDTPESTQLCRADDSRLYRCGAKAANELDAFIAGRPVSCASLSQDQYGRTVASCSVNGADLSEWLVRSGLALDWPQYSKGRYALVQREADRAGRGVWAGSYVAPGLYRACLRAQGSPANCSDDANAHP